MPGGCEFRKPSSLSAIGQDQQVMRITDQDRFMENREHMYSVISFEDLTETNQNKSEAWRINISIRLERLQEF